MKTYFTEQSERKVLSELTLDILFMSSKYYFYILKCSDNNRYYGHTNDLHKRLRSHLEGRVLSTKNRRPLDLIYYEEYDSRSLAFRREMQFKNGKTRKATIDKLIQSFPKTKCQGFNSRTLQHLETKQL